MATGLPTGTVAIKTADAPSELGEVWSHLAPALGQSCVKMPNWRPAQEDHGRGKKQKTSQEPSGKGKGKGKGKHKRQSPSPIDDDQDMQHLAKTMGQLVVRLDRQVRLMQGESSLVAFMQTGQTGILPLMLQETANWLPIHLWQSTPGQAPMDTSRAP